MIKALAAKHGLALGTHRSVSEFLSKFDGEHPDWELAVKFAHANTLQVNFYEDMLPAKLVEKAKLAVKDMISILRELL